jgi:RecA/RadA recombinase
VEEQHLLQIMPRPRKIKKEEVGEFLNPIDQYYVQSAAAVQEKYGSDHVSSALEEDANIQYLEVPDLGVQWSLGRKGFGLGRIMQIMGSEGSSKTSFALWVANLCMEAGGISAMVETEMASSTKHMLNYLKNPEKFRIFHAESIEDALQMTIEQLNLFLKIDPQGKIPKVLILDSIAGSTDARAQKDEENFIQAKVGGSAKIIKDATNLIKCKLRETNTLWVVLNQGRELIQTGFATLIPDIDKMVGSGGKAIPFAATYWLILKRNAATKEDGTTSGFKVKAMFKKNKLGEPNRVFYFNVKWGESLNFVDYTTNLLAIATPSDPDSKGGILGIQDAKGGRYYSEELGISKNDAITAEEMYKLAHSKENYEKCQQELEVIMEDKVLKYETKGDGSKGAVSDGNVNTSGGSTPDTDSEETESGFEAVESTETSDTD